MQYVDILYSALSQRQLNHFLNAKRLLVEKMNSEKLKADASWNIADVIAQALNIR